MMEKRTIGILFGGASSEHDVSLMSATSVLENIDRKKYDVVMVGHHPGRGAGCASPAR